jgi:hypothetical protein
MAKHNYILGIDPDAEKSGVATIRTSDRHIECQSLTFPKLIEYFLFCKKMSEGSLIVVVEAGWHIESNWHTNRNQSHRVAAAIGNKTGRNHETGRKIVEMCKHYGIEVLEVRPLKKCWSGPDGKITQEEISQFIPGFPSRSNQETRDAALLAWHYAGYEIRIKIVRKAKTV